MIEQTQSLTHDLANLNKFSIINNLNKQLKEKNNQIFFLEIGAQVFTPPADLKIDISNFNLTNKLIRKTKTLGKEQKQRYIELGKMCEQLKDDDL